MTKIELFEEKLIKEGLTDEKLLEYDTLLHRAGNDWNRIQHCFTTANRFPVECLDEAVKLIKFGIDRYGSDRGKTIPAYEMLGEIYERAGYYQKAYEIYVAIFPDIGGFKGHFPWCLLDMKMQVDNFVYSEETEDYMKLCLSENDFSKAFLKNRFTLALADYIVADYYDNQENKSNAYDAICKMLEPEYRGPLYNILLKHRYHERLQITAECRAFLDRIER